MDEAPTAATEQVLHLNQQVSTGIGRRDVAALERLLADDFVFKSSRGWWGKERWLANVARWDAYDDEFFTLNPRVYGDVVVLHAHLRIRATLDGRNRSGEQYLTDIWARRGDRWQLVSRQWSAVDPAAREVG